MKCSDTAAVIRFRGLRQVKKQDAVLVDVDVVKPDRLLKADSEFVTQARDIYDMCAMNASRLDAKCVFYRPETWPDADRLIRFVIKNDRVGSLVEHFERDTAKLDIAAAVHRRLWHTPTPETLLRCALLPDSFHNFDLVIFFSKFGLNKIHLHFNPQFAGADAEC